jgi:6,7-dimethyl-8-ribityllumazine synthase
MGKTSERRPSPPGLRIAIVVSRFHASITRKLLQGAQRQLLRHGVESADMDVVWVPGAFELPQAVRALASTDRYDGILPLGCVIRGETPHFEYICQSVTAGLTQLALEIETPIAYGVLTTDTVEQAAARAGSRRNKGAEAAKSLIELIRVLHSLPR